MPKVPARTMAKLEKYTRVYGRIKSTKPAKARAIKRLVLAVTLLYLCAEQPPRPAYYVSASVRNFGIWRDWRRAGLQLLEDRALIRFCGFPKAAVEFLAGKMAEDPEMATLLPGSKWWKHPDPACRPICDVLDVTVLVLRQIATIGYQHQLCSDMGVPQGSITKYLLRGKRVFACVSSQRLTAPRPS